MFSVATLRNVKLLVPTLAVDKSDNSLFSNDLYEQTVRILLMPEFATLLLCIVVY